MDVNADVALALVSVPGRRNRVPKKTLRAAKLRQKSER